MATPTSYFNMFQAKNDLTWSGSDGMASVNTALGTYWLCGDTILSDGENPDGSYAAGWKMIPNRILLQRPGTLSLTNAMANNGQGIPNPATRTAENQERYWALNGAVVNGFLYVLAGRVKNTPDGFLPLGVELAKYRIALDGKLTLIAMVATPSTGVTGGFGPNTIQWGEAMIPGTDGYIYVYGSTRAKDNPYVPIFSYAARVIASQLDNPSAWRFYKKTTKTWVPMMGHLDQNLTDQPDALLATQVSDAAYWNGKFHIIHKPWNGWGKEVYLEESASPVGPFTQRKLFDSPAGSTPEGISYQTYGPRLHADQLLTSYKMLVSINYAPVNFADTARDADLAKPRFWEIAR